MSDEPATSAERLREQARKVYEALRKLSKELDELTEKIKQISVDPDPPRKKRKD